MPSAQEDLETFAHAFGGLRPVDDDPTDLIYARSLYVARSRANSFRGWVNVKGAPLKLACGFVKEREMNAVVGREGETHCIAVYEPLMGAFFDFFTAMMSIPGFLPGVGDTNKEDAKRLLERGATLGFGYVAGASETKEEAQLKHLTLPNCPLRAQFGMHLAHVAYDFVWSHELWHAAMGHVDFARSMNIRRLNEAPGRDGDARILPLEVEADRLASFWVIDQAFQKDTPYLAAQIKLEPFERLHIIRLALVLTAFFWAHLQRIEVDLTGSDPYGPGSHPTPLMRLHLALSNSRRYARDRRGLPELMASKLDEWLIRELQRLSSAMDWFTKLDPDIVFSEATRVDLERTTSAVSALKAEQANALKAHGYFAAVV